MQDEGNGWYVLEIPGVQCANIVLNNTSSPQSSDLLNVCGEQWYDNGWLSQITGNNALPVSMLSFAGQKENAGVRLHWKVSGEENLKQYWVERSQDGRSFLPIGAVTARNSRLPLQYQFMDLNLPAAGDWYYRLKVEETDGSFSYSVVVKIFYQAAIGWQLAPNPVKNRLILSNARPMATAGTITITDGIGRRIYSAVVAQGTSIIQVARSPQWLTGVYWVELKDITGRKVFNGRMLVD
jgi:hypothetical protein